MDLSALKQKLLPCDMDSPFVFISYSAADKELVWTDVFELQQRGYNIWIDEANLDKSKDSWKEDALRAIEDYNCALLIFYVSRNSLTSEPCLNELERTIAQATQETHLGKVDCIAIDAENVGNMGDFVSNVGLQIERSGISSTEKSQKTRILFRFKTNWFREDNEKVRIHPKTEKKRLGDYYLDIEKELNRNRREIRLTPEKLYRSAVRCIVDNKYGYAKAFLEAGASVYEPSALLLAHMYHTGSLAVSPDSARARRLWAEVEKSIPFARWKQTGLHYDASKFYSEAIAFFLAHGEKASDPDSLFMASKMWLKKGCQSQAIAALRLSVKLGSDKARVFLSKLYSYDEDEVYKHAYRDEAPVK